MKKGIVIILLLGIFIIIFFKGIFPNISNFVGWNGYKMWENRSKTNTIVDSKKRKVFVKELNYKILDSTNLGEFHFKPYLERGYRVGRYSYHETKIITNTDYPYNICFERNLKNSIAVYYSDNSKKKLDSFDGYWGYLKNPYIKDTLYLILDGEKIDQKRIKIW